MYTKGERQELKKLEEIASMQVGQYEKVIGVRCVSTKNLKFSMYRQLKYGN
jgi:hypothetical protein